MKIMGALIAAAVLLGCGESERCWKNEDAALDAAFSKELAARGITARLDQRRGVCVPKANAGALDEAYRRINEYRSEVAALASDECEQRALVDWAKRENLRYDVLPSTTSDGRPSGNMLIVRSSSAEEVAANREKLRRELPKIQRCPK